MLQCIHKTLTDRSQILGTSVMSGGITYIADIKKVSRGFCWQWFLNTKQTLMIISQYVFLPLMTCLGQVLKVRPLTHHIWKSHHVNRPGTPPVSWITTSRVSERPPVRKLMMAPSPTPTQNVPHRHFRTNWNASYLWQNDWWLREHTSSVPRHNMNHHTWIK